MKKNFATKHRICVVAGNAKSQNHLVVRRTTLSLRSDIEQLHTLNLRRLPETQIHHVVWRTILSSRSDIELRLI
jgi:hypothetical protein